MTPIMLTQGECPWNPKADEHNSPINDNFNKEVEAAAEVDVQVEAEESNILMTRKISSEEKESQAARIFSSLADLHTTTSKEDLETSVPTTSNQEMVPVLVTQE